MWLDQASIATYKEAQAFFNTARNKDKGKPLRSWALLKQDGDDYVVHMKHWSSDSEVGRFKPDNTFVFTMDIPTARRFAVTLSQALYGAIPFWWNRVGTGRYEICPIKQAVTKFKDRYWDTLKELAIPYSKGLTFDLTTHTATNAKVNVLSTVVSDKRVEWLRASKKFKMGIRTKAKMGIIEGIIDQIHQERANNPKGNWTRPDWFSEYWSEKLYTAVKNNDTSISTIKLIAESAFFYSYRRMTTQDVLDSMETIFREQSLELRRRFGVFKQENDDGQTLS
jgi:hypothetical protein